MNPIRTILLITLHVICLSAISQKEYIKFRRLGTEQGLSQSNVICMLQDSRGFMWFGTRDGLNKYDGYKFTVYRNEAKNTNSLGNNFIRSIAEGKDGNLWIATSGGVSYYDRAKDRFTVYKNNRANNSSLSSDFATSVLVDSRGVIWVGTGDGLNQFDTATKKFTRYLHKSNDPNSLGDSHIRTVFEDSQGEIWVGTLKGGLNLFNRQTQTFTHFLHNEKDAKTIGSNNIYTVFEDKKHRLWIGTNGAGLDLFDKNKMEFLHFRSTENDKNSLASNSVYAINEADDHNLWIGTENGGLNVFNPETNLFYTYQNDRADNTSISNNSVYCIYKDKKGDMWLGTFNGGINLVTPEVRLFTQYKHILSANSLSNDNVLCIYEDKEENIWIGTDGGGLNLFDQLTGQFTYFGHTKNDNNSICGDYVLSVCEDNEGNIWIGTWGDGVTVMDKTHHVIKQYKNNPLNAASLSSNNAWKIYKDHDGVIWIGTNGGGLNRFDAATKSFTHYQYNENDPTGISNNNVQCILEDKTGQIWVSTDGGGLNLFDRKTRTFSHFTHTDKENSVASKSIGTIYEDKKGNIWLGTMAGLSCYDKKTQQFINYTTADGLPNNVVFGILEDSKGNLWVSTNKGISRFNPAKKVFKNFGISDGLQSNEFKEQAFCQSHTGAMYFGGVNGFNQFYPDRIKSKPFNPPLVITGFQLFNKEVTISNDTLRSPLKKSITETKEISLPYSSSVISFEFASLNYMLSDKKQYQYKLEGFDTRWNDIGSRHTATYTNLNPGSYTFKVRGLDNDGNWSDSITTLDIMITPPFWLTWWFKTIVVLFGVVCLFTIYRLRLRAITRQKVKLEKQVKQRTEQIQRQKEELSIHLTELATLKENLEQEKYFLDSLMDNMPDAIYFKDKESRLIRVSKYMANRFGSSVDDLIGKTDFDIQHELHAREAYGDEQDIMETRKAKIDYVEKEVWEDGSEHWVSTTKMPLLNGRAEVIGTFGISRDITKVKMLEQESHGAVLEKAVAQGKFEIASDVMHDIGNAVVGFGAYVTRVRRLLEKEKPENLQQLANFFETRQSALIDVIGEAKTNAVVNMLNGMSQSQKNNLEEMNKSITEQLNIIMHIQEILNIQRQYITGHESKERKSVNLRSIVNDSVSMAFASIDKMAIDVSLNIQPDLPIIKGDRTKLMQVVLNILKNSIEAIDKDSDNKSISFDAYTNADKLVLKISDTGAGFDKTTASSIFKRGFTTKSTGSGLGLYNCRSIIESHDGTIDISSEGPGKGAITTIGFKLSA